MTRAARCQNRLFCAVRFDRFFGLAYPAFYWRKAVFSDQSKAISRIGKLLAVFHLALLFLLSGCVSKAKADAQVRAAFLAGQQQAMQQMQTRGPTVTFLGEVRNNLVPWTAGLTLAQGLVAADYFGVDPKAIIIRRDNEQIVVEASRLLSGEDIPLQPRDVIEVSR